MRKDQAILLTDSMDHSPSKDSIAPLLKKFPKFYEMKIFITNSPPLVLILS
jgi:hypothetical protein